MIHCAHTGGVYGQHTLDSVGIKKKKKEEEGRKLQGSGKLGGGVEMNMISTH